MTREEAIKELKIQFLGEYDRQREAKNIAIKVLEQEPILDNIKRDVFNACCDNYHMPVYKLDCDEIFEIIDKYTAESGDNT